MAEILQFETKQARQVRLQGDVPPTPPTPEELYQTLYTKALDQVRSLTRDLRATGKFDVECEQSMILVIMRLKQLCQNVTGVTGEDDGPKEVAG